MWERAMQTVDNQIGGIPPLDGDRNFGPILLGVNWGIFGPSWVFVVLRTISRVWISRNFGWDDAMMIFTQMINSVGMGFVTLEVHYGLGRHKFFFNHDRYIGFLKYDYLDWSQVFITLATCKIAICLFLLRISKFDRWRNFLYGMIAFLTVTHLAITIVYIFQCRPVNKVWSQEIPGQCWSPQTVMDIIIVQGVVSILTDLVLAAFPILLLWNMKLPRRQKWALNLLMGLGVVTAMVCIIRTVFSYEVKADDKSWAGVPNALCRMLEINFGIIAACMPMMRPMWNLARQRWKARNGPRATTRTPMSRIQWYRPPHSAPWYRRMPAWLQGAPQPPVSKTSSEQSMNSAHRKFEDEKKGAVLPNPKPQVVPKAMVNSKWPQHYEKPENVTWAKDPGTPKMSNSLDLPLQGVKSGDWDREKRESHEPDWGGFDFSRGLK